MPEQMNYKPIRNKLGRFTYNSLVRELLSVLKNQEKSSRPQAFWQGLLLLRWAIEFGGRNYPLKEATRKDIVSLYQQIEKLENAHNIFYPGRNGGNLKKTFIILSLQQMVYQEKAFWDCTARQYLLFNQLRHKYDIAGSFERLTGISITDFLKVLHFKLLLLLNDTASEKIIKGISIDMFPELVEIQFGPKLSNQLFKLWTISRESINEAINMDTRQIRNYDLQIFEPSIFTRRPMFLFDNRVIIPHRDILNVTINHFIYEFMKNKDPEFSPELGRRMEKYVEMGLHESGIDFKNENELKSRLGKHHTLVDFLLEDHIVVEVKGIEVKPFTAANPTDEILANEFRQNIVKAYCTQMLPVVSTIATSGTEYFGIIITYRDLMLGNATDLWDQFLKEEAEKIGLNEASVSLLPVENLFVMDLRTWDYLVHLLKSKQVTLKELLIKIRETDKDPITKKYNFRMHLDDYSCHPLDLSYLLEVREELD